LIEHTTENDLAETIDTNTYSTNETLFDLLHEKRVAWGQNNKISDFEYDYIQNNSNLNALLRPYQINAVKWMLNRENVFLNGHNTDDRICSPQVENQMHPLYTKIKNKMGQIIYYHLFYGLYRLTQPKRVKSMNGGILADEMGLGKTLEILALISMNPRPMFGESFDNVGRQTHLDSGNLIFQFFIFHFRMFDLS
jgi:E3 ubiquitin-protein ligase SHPRH